MTVLEQRDVWKQIHPTWDEKVIGMRAVMNHIVEHCGDIGGTIWLDVGCHTGYFSFQLANRGASVTGIDIHKPNIDTANTIKRNFNLTNPTFIHTDVKLFSGYLRGVVDGILLLNVFHHMIARYGEDLAWKILNSLLAYSTFIFFMVRPYWNRGKDFVVDVAGKGSKTTWKDVENVILEKSDATWIEDLGLIPNWKYRHLFVFGRA